ncbi:MAG TPA: hypothetical protein PK400_06330 [Phycisphaerales bacterium]|nr:hypothetical protein [Phycisphaerales bacterium]HRQ75829.1 hypothetical protein [Phycisphaerales bacterium]
MKQSTPKTIAAAAVIAVSGAALAGTQAGGDGKHECVVRKATPNWMPGAEGEWGDTLGVLSLSHNGRYVAYSSYTTLYLPNAGQMHGHIQQIIVRDTVTQQGELISAAYNPSKGETISANAHCEWYLDMSPNGRYVAFVSLATNLTADEVSGQHYQVYVRDRQEQTTYLASKSTKGEVANDWGSDVRVGVSNNGRVAFASRANNLHPDQPITMWAVYVHDIHTGVTELVSRDVFGNPATIDTWGPSISADGNTVAFVGIAPLVPGMPFHSQDVFVRDLAAGITEIVSVDENGANRPAAGGYFPRLSHDGNRVAFRYDNPASSLDPNFPPGYFDVVYVRDRAANRTVGLNRTWDNQPATLNPEGGFTLSGDGAYLAWDSIDQVTPEPVSPIWHVYRTHVDSLNTTLVTIDPWCQPVPKQHDMMWSAISGDGHHVVFNSMWNIMQSDDFDWSRHLYVWVDPAGPQPNPADLNNDGVVDVQDLLILLVAWGPCGDECPADLNGDGVVDVLDLLFLLGNWG